MEIDFGSVCSGIEAASVAWHPLGWRTSWLAEIEAFPCAVLAHRFPSTPNLGDMTAIASQVLAGRVPAPAVLVGGTPCQAFSVAGLRGGLTDARGQLSIAFVELADAIDHVRARRGEPGSVVVWENVPGVLSSRDNAFGCFLGALVGEDCDLVPPGKKWANAGCVYGPQRAVAWRVLNAEYFGLAQRRRRVFVVASARPDVDPAAVLLEFEGRRRDHAPRREAREGASRAVARSVALRGREGGGTAELGDTIADALRASTGGGDKPHVLVAGSLDAALDRGATEQGARLGHIVPVGDLDGVSKSLAATSTASDYMDASVETYVAHSLRAEGFDASEDGTGRRTPIVPVAFNQKMGAKAGGIGLQEDCAPTLGTLPGASAVAFVQNSRDEVRLMGGDGAIVGAIAAEPGMKQQHFISDSVGVRRITPTECERLQGFPDGWTLIPFGSRKAIEASTLLYLRLTRPDLTMDEARGLAADGPRYRALGNSMPVNVMHWIGRRIDAAIRKAA